MMDNLRNDNIFSNYGGEEFFLNFNIIKLMDGLSTYLWDHASKYWRKMYNRRHDFKYFFKEYFQFKT